MAPSRKVSTTPWNHASLNHSTLFETGSKGVWHGRGLLGLCFVNSLSPSSLMGKLEHFLNRQELKDCLLVQPIRVVLPNERGLSPLNEWVEHGYLDGAGNVSALNRKTTKSGQVIKVELRHPRRRKGALAIKP